MRFLRSAVAISFVSVSLASCLPAQAVKTGDAAFETYADEKPGNRVHITLQDLPDPHPD